MALLPCYASQMQLVCCNLTQLLRLPKISSLQVLVLCGAFAFSSHYSALAESPHFPTVQLCFAAAQLLLTILDFTVSFRFNLGWEVLGRRMEQPASATCVCCIPVLSHSPWLGALFIILQTQNTPQLLPEMRAMSGWGEEEKMGMIFFVLLLLLQSENS